MKLKLIALAAVLFSLACSKKDPNYDPHNTPLIRYMNFDHENKTGKIIRYYEDGKRKSVGFYKMGKKDSLFRTWHQDGSKNLEIWYKDGDREGLYKKYHKNGNVYREIQYEMDFKNGEYIEYYSTGKIKYQLAYDFDMAIDGTMKEYQLNGTMKPDKYLVLEEINTIKKNGKFVVLVYFADTPDESLYTIHYKGAEYVLDKRNGKGYFEVEVIPGYEIMEKIAFEGYYEGRKETIKAVKKSYNLGVENL